MSKLTYLTGNKDKFESASFHFKIYGVELIQEKIDLQEIQAEDSLNIVKDKLDKAFNLIKKPLIVTDISWYFNALNGFPGPYMKYVNNWLKCTDLLAMYKDKKDKTFERHHYIGYKDTQKTKIFKIVEKGEVLDKKYGEDVAINEMDKVITFDLVNKTPYSLATNTKRNAHYLKNKNKYEEIINYIKLL